MARKVQADRQFGDFQTPAALARLVLQSLKTTGVMPATVIEPTCGRGSFLLASAEMLPSAKRLLGFDINQDHLDSLSDEAKRSPGGEKIEAVRADFFLTDWDAVLAPLEEPLLIVGNPPWVTNAELGTLGSQNLPQKSNFQGLKGFDAVTGKSNFDISEWMLLRNLEWLRGRAGLVAVLVKTAVARKVLRQAWQEDRPLQSATMVRFDANKYFGVSVDACLLVLNCVESSDQPYEAFCHVYEDFALQKPSGQIGYEDGVLVSDLSTYSRLRHLGGGDPHYVWRTGVKHDSAKIMEFKPEGAQYINGFGEPVTLEKTYLYPLLKSSDVAAGRVDSPRKSVLITQQRIGQATDPIASKAPFTWRYLQGYKDALDRRRSSIYRGKPAFSIFGIGEYAFAPWKVAISGFYKSLQFRPVGPVQGRPVMFDDTVNFLACWSEEEADLIAELLNSAPAQSLLKSMLFLDEKRPVTVEILKRLNLHAVAKELGLEDRFIALTTAGNREQPALFGSSASFEPASKQLPK